MRKVGGGYGAVEAAHVLRTSADAAASLHELVEELRDARFDRFEKRSDASHHDERVPQAPAILQLSGDFDGRLLPEAVHQRAIAERAVKIRAGFDPSIFDFGMFWLRP